MHALKPEPAAPSLARRPATLETPTGIAAPASWRDRWRNWRNRRLANPAFRAWAARQVWARPFARQRARGLFDLMAGFVYTQVLLGCVRLQLFERLAAGPQTAPTLAAVTGFPEPALMRLLDAAASLQLLERQDSGAWGLGVLGAPMVGEPGLAAMVEHHAVLYADLNDPLSLLRRQAQGEPMGAMAAYWPYVHVERPGQLGDAQVATYSALMSASLPLVAQEVLDAYPLDRHRCLLDVGGGEGRFAEAAAARAPGLDIHLFDLPAVADRARERLASRGLGARCTVHGGDFLRDPLPLGADIISLIRVAFDHPDERVLAILRAVRKALPAGGTLLLAEPMAGTPGAEAMGDAYFGFYLMAMGRGRPRTPAEFSALLVEAGFSTPRALPTRLPIQTRVLVARAV